MARIFKGVSIVIHAVVITVLSYAQLFDAGVIPTPRSILAFEGVTIADVPPAPAPRRTAQAPAAAVPAGAAPIVAPDAITTETGREHETTSPPRGDLDRVEGSGNGPIDGFGTAVAPPAPPPAPPITRPIPVGGDIRRPVKTVHVDPIYPALAQAARKQGVVILEVVIDTSGRVESVRVLRGEPMLDKAATTAVEQWRFAPATLNGQAVPVVMTVTVNFQLTP